MHVLTNIAAQEQFDFSTHSREQKRFSDQICRYQGGCSCTNRLLILPNNLSQKTLRIFCLEPSRNQGYILLLNWVFWNGTTAESLKLKDHDGWIHNRSVELSEFPIWTDPWARILMRVETKSRRFRFVSGLSGTKCLSNILKMSYFCISVIKSLKKERFAVPLKMVVSSREKSQCCTF